MKKLFTLVNYEKIIYSRGRGSHGSGRKRTDNIGGF